MLKRLNKRIETIYDSANEIRRAKALLNSAFLVGLAYIIYFLALIPQHSSIDNTEAVRNLGMAVGAIGTIIILMGTFYFLLRGKLRPASTMMAFGFWPVTTIAFIIPFGIIYASVASIVLLNILLAALYLERRASNILAGLYGVTLIIAGVLQALHIPPVPPAVGWEVFQDGIALILIAVVSSSVLATLIEQYAMATEQAESHAKEMELLVDALEQQTDRLSVINEISQMSTDMLAFDSIGQLISDKLIPLLSPEHVSIGFIEANRRDAEFTTFHGPDMPAHIPLQKTPFEFAIEDNRTVRLNYRDHQMGTRFLYQIQGIKFLLIIPLSIRDQVFGTINIGFSETDTIIADDVILCEQVAKQLAVMIDNMQLYGRLDENIDEHATLYNTSLAISAASDLSSIADMAMREVANISDADRVDLFIAGPDPHNIVSYIENLGTWQDGQSVIQNRPDQMEFIEYPFLSTVNNLRANIVATGGDIEENVDLEFRRYFLDSGVTSLLVMPLLTGPIWLGFFVIQGYDEQVFSSIQIRLCRSIADQVALAIDSQVLLSQAQRTAHRERVVNKLSYQMDRANSLNEIAEIALKEIKETLGSQNIKLRLGTPSTNPAEIDRGENND